MNVYGGIKENDTKHRFMAWKRSLYSQGEGAFPKLSGTAAQIRALAKPLLDVFTIHRSACSDPHLRLVNTQIRMLLKTSVSLENIIDDNRGVYRWPTVVCQRFMDETCKYLALQKGISNFFDEQTPAIPLFNITIKSHMLVHCAAYSFGINPAMFWNYMGEDFMKRIKVIAQSNTRGTHWANVNAKLIEQYVRGMDFSTG